MQTVIKHFPVGDAVERVLTDETSGLANLERNTGAARTPLVVGLVIVAAAFCLGIAAGALITFFFFKI